MKTLDKIFSRERSLFYFMLWHDSDQGGIRRYLEIKMPDGLFIVRPQGQVCEVWYPRKDLAEVNAAARERINADANLRASALGRIHEGWAGLLPYLDETISIRDAASASAYYKALLHYWDTLNTVMFELAGTEEVHAEFREGVLEMRAQTERYTENMDQLFISYFQKAFPELAVFAHYVSPYELERIERDPSDPEMRAILEERKARGCFIYAGIVRPLGELVATMKENSLVFDSSPASDVSEVTGRSAYRGTVRGVARVLGGKGEIDRVQEGDILITASTTPDFIPAMKRAAAFVTDEGSLTCHAAIVAREMKKPCIVGTKIATKVFKDGDIVEVDAEKGIVRRV